ncbi:MAG: hypothetical protein IPL03_04050 [Sterolibacteriaceae bacterium]|nr:hypothetical protein [Candidatus Methylophosphatis haderslevensis]
MSRVAFLVGAAGICTMLLMACERIEPGEQKMATPAAISAAEWKSLSRVKVLFGHQSVGYNILEGVEKIAASDANAQLKVVHLKDPKEMDGPALGHFEVGQNTAPDSKIADFLTHLEAGGGDRADVAMLKFCYVDVSEATDIPRLFDAYKGMIGRAKSKYPKLRIAHITMPLVSRQTGFQHWLKSIAKRVLGRPIRNIELNIKRNEFNELLRREYGQIDPIFDLEKIESTGPNGEAVVEIGNGNPFKSLSPDYTEDGGHLNERGQLIVARKFLHFLAAISQPGSSLVGQRGLSSTVPN